MSGVSKRKLPTFKVKTIAPTELPKETKGDDLAPIIVKRKTQKRTAKEKYAQSLLSDPATRVEQLPDSFYPINRFGFASSIVSTFGPAYTLPKQTEANPERCTNLAYVS